MKQLTALLTDESFQRWLNGHADVDETAQWENWLAEGNDNKRIYEQATTLWEAVQFEPTALPQVHLEWQKLQTRLNLSGGSGASPSETGYHRGRLERHSRPKRFAWVHVSVAAALALILTFVVKYSSLLDPGSGEVQSFQTLSTEFGQRVTLTFPDETRVILNANSILRYPADWAAGGTNVLTLQGEAYFDVSPIREPNSKLEIETTDGLVSVVGTEFAVYERGRGTRIVVAEGNVGVAVADTSANLRPRVLLEKGHLLHFTKGSRELNPEKVAVEPYTTWWQRELVLVQTRVAEIVQRLEETYGVEVKVLDERLLDRTLSGSIENQNIVIVTDAIAEALKVSVTRNGQVIIFGKPAK